MNSENEPAETDSSKKILYPTSKLAIASLVLGFPAIWALGILAAIPAIICGHLALREIKLANENISGKGYAVFGMIVGYLEFAVLVITAVAAPIVLSQLKQEVQTTFQQIQSTQASH